MCKNRFYIFLKKYHSYLFAGIVFFFFITNVYSFQSNITSNSLDEALEKNAIIVTPYFHSIFLGAKMSRLQIMSIDHFKRGSSLSVLLAEVEPGYHTTVCCYEDQYGKTVERGFPVANILMFEKGAIYYPQKIDLGNKWTYKMLVEAEKTSKLYKDIQKEYNSKKYKDILLKALSEDEIADIDLGELVSHGYYDPFRKLGYKVNEFSLEYTNIILNSDINKEIVKYFRRIVAMIKFNKYSTDVFDRIYQWFIESLKIQDIHPDRLDCLCWCLTIFQNARYDKIIPVLENLLNDKYKPKKLKKYARKTLDNFKK